MIVRSKAPLRIGLAGGGTDVCSYSDEYGGAILNATISMYAYASICPRDDGRIVLHCVDRGMRAEMQSEEYLEPDTTFALLKGVYNRVVRDFVRKPLSFELLTYVDAPAGSGLGSSSTLVVAILGAFVEWLKLPLGEYDIARLAYEIERRDLKMAGGKQDQYAATFGGFNFMEFYADDKVIVNPLRIKNDYIHEMAFNILLYYTGTNRLSAQIIEAQTRNVVQKSGQTIEAMHQLKKQAVMMKEAILTGEIGSIGTILDFGWQNKKKTAPEVTNPLIDTLYQAAIDAGATGGKISGAGGGGFMMFFCPENARYAVIETLKQFGGEFRRYSFVDQGLITWKTKK